MDTAPNAYTVTIDPGANLANSTNLANGSELEFDHGTVINQGTLSATSTDNCNAIRFNGTDDIVINEGMITGSYIGVSAEGSLSVTNSGTITGNNQAAVYSSLDTTGAVAPVETVTVTNSGSLLSSAGDGIDAFDFNTDSTGTHPSGEMITLTNTGIINAAHDGISLDGGTQGGGGNGFNTLNVTNSGSMTVDRYGIVVDVLSNEDNAGKGTNTVNLTNSGTLTAGEGGIYLETENTGNGGNGLNNIAVANTGSLTSGDGEDGVEIHEVYNYENAGEGVNNVSFVNTGSINAAFEGLNGDIFNEDNQGNNFDTVTFKNSGSITSVTSEGVDYEYVGNYENVGNATINFTANNSGTITSGAEAFYVEAYNEEDSGNGITHVTLNNSGSIDSTDNYALEVYEGGNYSESGKGISTVNVLNTGTITGEEGAVYVYEGNESVGGHGLSTISVMNAGLITAGNDEGVYMESFNEDNGGSATTRLSLINLAQGHINSNAEAVNIQAPNDGNEGTGLNSTSVVFENAGTIQGGSTAVHITAGNSASAGNASATINIMNTGKINGNQEGVFASVDNSDTAGNSRSTITLVNSGTIFDGVGTGVDLENQDSGTIGTSKGSIVITNAPTGVIFGSDEGIFVSNDDTTASHTAKIVNAGSIIGGADGIELGSNYGTVLTTAGIISGGTNAISLEGTQSTVTIRGRTDMVGVIQGNGNAGNTLNFNLIGFTSAETALAKAAVAAAAGGPGTFTGGGDTYNFDGFSDVNFNADSFAQNVDPGLRSLAVRIDNNPLSNAYDAVYAQGALNAEAALNSLSGRQFLDAFREVGLSNATAMSELADSRAFSLRSGTSGLDLSGLNISPASMIASLGDTQSILNRIGSSAFGGTSMSDSKTMSDSKDEKTMTSSDAPRWGAWASGTVTFADQSNSNNLGYNSTSGSPTIGVDYKICPDVAVGALFNYTTGYVNFGDGSDLDTDTEFGALYASWTHQHWYVTGLAGYGQTSYDQNRSTLGGDQAHASPDGDQVLATVNGGYDFTFGGWIASPEVGLQYTHLSKDSFNETGAGAFNLNVGDEDVDSLRTKVGFHATHLFTWKSMKLVPEVNAAWYHECFNDTNGVSTSLPGSPALGSFVVDTRSQGRDFALVGAGVSAMPAQWHDSVSFFLNYDAQVGQSDFIAHTVDGGVRVSF